MSVIRKSIFAFSLIFLYSCQTTKTEVIIFPDEFEGTAAIHYNSAEGEDLEYENDTLYIRIPPSGILYLQNSLDENSKYVYFLKENGQLVKDLLLSSSIWEDSIRYQQALDSTFVHRVGITSNAVVFIVIGKLRDREELFSDF